MGAKPSAAAAIGGVMLGAVSLGSAAKAEGTQCHLAQIAAIPVIFEHNKPLVRVTINGQPALMVADTGASRSMMFAPAARRMGLNPVYEGGEIIGVGGARSALRVTVSLGLGDAKPTNVPLMAVDDRGWPDEIVGLMGLDFFGQTETEFDIAGGFIRLFSAEHCERTNLAYWTKEPMVADMQPGGIGVGSYDLELKLNGRTVMATLDSGAGTSIATTEAAARAGARPSEESVDGQVYGLGAEKVAVTTVVFQTLAIGDEEIKNAKLKVGDMFRAARDTSTGSRIAYAEGAPEMLLGADFLRSHRAIVSRSQHRMYFTYSGGPVFQVVAPADGAAKSKPPASAKP